MWRERNAGERGLILKPLERKHPEAKRPTGVTSIRLTHRVESMRFQRAAPGPLPYGGQFKQT